MNIQAALLKAAETGTGITRSGSTEWVQYDPSRPLVLSIADLTADDWEVVAPPPKVEKLSDLVY